MTFEEKINKLEEICSNLQSKNTTLDDALKLYSKGVKLLNECKEDLKSFELKVETLGDINDFKD